MGKLNGDNLAFWNSVEETDPHYTKPVNYGGRKYTTIDAYYQIKTATEMWGMYGNRWGLTDIIYTPVENTPMMMVSARFRYPNPDRENLPPTDLMSHCSSFAITTAIKVMTGKGQFDDDFAKKAETDLITKSLSRLGFNADVFLGKFDDNKYVVQLGEKYTAKYTDEDKKQFDDLIENNNAIEFYNFVNHLDADTFTSLYNSFPRGKKGVMKEQVKRLEADGKEIFDACLDQINSFLESEDAHGLLELVEDLSQDTKAALFRNLDNEHRFKAHELLKK